MQYELILLAVCLMIFMSGRREYQYNDDIFKYYYTLFVSHLPICLLLIYSHTIFVILGTNRVF